MAVTRRYMAQGDSGSPQFLSDFVPLWQQYCRHTLHIHPKYLLARIQEYPVSRIPRLMDESYIVMNV